MKKVLLLLFMVFIFFQVFAGSVNALECSIGCKQNGPMDSLRCQYQLSIPKIGSVYSTCMINPYNDGTTVSWSYGSSCYDATNNNFCKSNGCPTNSDNSGVANQNGKPCNVILPCVSGSSCGSIDLSGKWDASESKCMKCDAVVTQKESKICGDSAGTYLGNGVDVYSPNINCPSSVFCSKSGDSQFESACGADSACDEKAQGDSCGTDYVCDANGKCIQKTVPCNYNNIQDNGETGTDCGGGGCPDCAVTPPPTTCTNPSSYYTDYDCTSGGCKWCSFGDSGACKSLSDSCPGIGITDTCPAQTSKAACDAQSGGSFSFDCGWCPNSYNGGTSANGGTCIKAENLASQCGGCFATESYYANTNYAECAGICPSYSSGTFPVSGASIYGGWCDRVNEYCTATGTRSCDCLGNKFNTAKSSDNIVNCGECAINADGQNCGGTAVTDSKYMDTTLGNVYYSNGGGLYGNLAAPCPFSFDSSLASPLDICKIYWPETNAYEQYYFDSDSNNVQCAFWIGGGKSR